MFPRPSRPVPASFRWSKTGFSLIEVTLAIGLLAFCMIPLIGLIPTGLNAQHSATESAFAADALAMLSTAFHSSQYVSRDASGAPTFRLPRYLSDNTDPVSNPTTYTAGQNPTTRTYALLEDGSIRKAGDTRTARQTMFIQTFPPATDSQLAAPPGGATITPSAAVRGLRARRLASLAFGQPDHDSHPAKKPSGFVESYISYVPTY